jgi:hypothetical protein
MAGMPLTDRESALHPTLVDDSAETTARTTSLKTLLFGLSLAAALPPAALLAPPDAALPAIRSDPHPVVGAVELGATLARPTVELGHGWIALGELDERLRGLVASLAVFQPTAGRGVLLSVGVVGPDRTASGTDAATTTGLWVLAREALARHGVMCERQPGIGDAALLVRYGGITVQVAWLAGERLATASVTSLKGDQEWMIGAARSIAGLLQRRLR